MEGKGERRGCVMAVGGGMGAPDPRCHCCII